MELLIASSIMAIMAGVLGGLALTVQMQSRFCQGHGEAVQHARVVLDRLQRALNEAASNSEFPGFVAVTETRAGGQFPTTVVAWRPAGLPASSTGRPRWSEVVIFTPHPTTPNILLEMRVPGDARVVPPLDDVSQWRSEIAAFKASPAAETIELTHLVRTVELGGSSTPLACIRFDALLRPSEVQWDEYQAGTRAWEEIDWVQGIHGTRTGLRQNWCRIELQLNPGSRAHLDDTTGQSTVTFFGSAAIYQKVRRD